MSNSVLLLAIFFISAPSFVSCNIFNFKVNYAIPYDNILKLLHINDTTTLNFAELATYNGYKSEQHNVTTEDGYILQVFRITSPNCSRTVGIPVFILHGIIESADLFLDAGVDNGLAYLIARECRDVWAGNYRGNYYGRAHQTLNPDTDVDFWNFSPDEIALYDLPAQFDYVLNVTGSEQINFIGFSLGGMFPFLLNNDKPDYVERVMHSYIGISPASRLNNTKSPLLRLLLDGTDLLHNFEQGNGIQEILFKGSVTQTTLAALCKLNNIVADQACDNVLGLLDAPHKGSIDDDSFDLIYAHFPAGTSLKLFEWNYQQVSAGITSKFDYGEQENLVIYGTEKPPAYNFSAFTIPSVLLRGLNDRVVDPKDVEWLSEQLPNILELFTVDDPLWNHVDNAYSKYVSTKLFPTVKKYLNTFLN